MKEAGRITVSDPGSDKVILEQGTLQCCHCGKHWQVKPGSGNVRGYCFKCNGPICGRGCLECVPFEKWLDATEKGLTPEQVGVSVAVPASLKLEIPGRPQRTSRGSGESGGSSLILP